MKYKKWSNMWINNYVKPYSKQKTIELYSETIRIHINPHFGDKKVENIDSYDIQQLINFLLIKGNKKKIIKDFLTHMLTK